ncbi:DUF2927 domain-containing protein [Vibrio salinus]|uniref:DUF2927 domain-containing protein n=1 Tax=Vibrio salinus TaxID=2899784 RepID=UPI001E29ADF1|nr:DUF2927 domain-containing protein [Vibrio salinus]MCE0492654.1 DUF2927 domain-containing protein [Vibrio salinus]
MKKLVITFLSIVIGFSAFHTSATTDFEHKWQSLPFIEKAFFEVALKNEFKTNVSPVLKWQTPVRYWIKHDVANRKIHDLLLKKHFQHLSEITHLPFSPAKNRSEANMLIFFTKQSLWKGIVRKEMGKRSAKNTYGSVCMFNIRAKKSTSVISKAVIVIPVDQARDHGKLIACIIEETTQSLGLKNDSVYAYPSIFNDKTPDTFLSPLDITLLKLLYNPAIKPGMNKKELKPVLTREIKKMKRSGELDKSIYQAVHSPLRLYLGM